MAKNNKITVQNTEITITTINDEDYISLTDMVKAKDDDIRAADVIKNWIRTRGTIEFLGTWESIYNPNFKVVEFDHFKKDAGLPTFTMSVSNWVESTNTMVKASIGELMGFFTTSGVFTVKKVKEFNEDTKDVILESLNNDKIDHPDEEINLYNVYAVYKYLGKETI